jgi:hypothetical protein
VRLLLQIFSWFRPGVYAQLYQTVRIFVVVMFSASDLPDELWEMILMKSVSCFYAKFGCRLLRCNARMLSVVSVCAVRCKWLELITNRSYNRCQLRRRFREKVKL